MEGSFMNLLVLALAVEVVTNLFKNYVKPLKGYTTWVAGALGILLCILTEVGLFSANGVDLWYSFIDYCATGVIVARLAGVINDLSKKLS